MQELALVESKTLRDENIDKVEVLSSFGFDLKLQYVTLKMAAEFFVTSDKTIESVVYEHRDEFETDGLKKFTYAEIKENPQFLGKAGIEISPRGCIGLTSRCILRLGMLLRDSQRVKDIRNAIMDTLQKMANITQSDEEFFAYAVVRANKRILELTEEKQRLAIANEQIAEERDLAHKRVGYLECRKNVRATEAQVQSGLDRVMDHYGLDGNFQAGMILIYKEFQKWTKINLQRRWKEAQKVKGQKQLRLHEYVVKAGFAEDYLKAVDALLANDNVGDVQANLQTEFF